MFSTKLTGEKVSSFSSISSLYLLASIFLFLSLIRMVTISLCALSLFLLVYSFFNLVWFLQTKSTDTSLPNFLQSLNEIQLVQLAFIYFHFAQCLLFLSPLHVHKFILNAQLLHSFFIFFLIFLFFFSDILLPSFIYNI